VAHPRVRITPHIASMTQPQTAARVAIDNLRRFERGEPLVGLVDRGRGLLIQPAASSAKLASQRHQARRKAFKAAPRGACRS
jgi:hypothetical protein